MGCCCDDDEVSEPLFSIEKENRPCTDVLGCLMLLAAMAFSILLFLYALQQGADPNLLIRGTDMWGNTCGINGNATTRPLTAWPNPLVYQATICVASCNETLSNPYMIVPYETQQLLYYCVPSTQAIASLGSNNVVTSTFGSSAALFSRIIGDLNVVWPVIAAGAGAAVLVSLFYVLLLKCMAGVLVWGSIACILAVGAASAYFLVNQGTQAMTTNSLGSQEAAQATLIAGYVMAGLTFLFFCAIVFLRERIRIAVQIAKEASSAVIEMPGMQLWPFFPFIALIIYAAYWLIAAMYLASVQVRTNVPLEAALTQVNPWGKPLPNPRVQMTFDERFKYLYAYHFFHLLWSMQFLFYFTYIVLAGAVADWYFTPFNKDQQKERGSEEGQLTNWPVLSSFFRSLKHCGTVAVCALIIAIIQFIRACIAYAQKKAEELGDQNPIARYTRACIFCCLQCFFKCLECCLDKINKNGLIITAIRGDNFCSGSCYAFRLVWNNVARVAAISLVGNTLIAVGQILVALACAAGAAAAMLYMEPFKTQCSSILLPTLIVFVLAYCVASLVLSIFDAAVDTIFICFLLDEEKNGNTGRMLASQNLQDIIAANTVEKKEGGSSADGGAAAASPEPKAE